MIKIDNIHFFLAFFSFFLIINKNWSKKMSYETI
jgi:hypothetical protein